MKPLVPEKIDCKCCNEQASIYDVRDFHKNCEEGRGIFLPHSGIPIYYHKCQNCGFLFSVMFDSFGLTDFKKHVYNDAYLDIDPDYVEKRPTDKAALVNTLLKHHNKHLSILDYGGGNGLMALKLKTEGFENIETYDPFSDNFSTLPITTFDLITCFEVFEHVVDPAEMVDVISNILNPDGGLLFSTRIQPEFIGRKGLDWWYASPRNGHISLYTRKSLKILLDKVGMKYISLNDNLHFAYKRFPEFSRDFGCVA